MSVTDSKLLIVDDLSTMRRIVRGLFEEIGRMNVIEADDAVALKMLKVSRGELDIVVSGFHVLKMKGLEHQTFNCNESRRRHEVYSCSHGNCRSTKRRYFDGWTQSGAADCAVKPFKKGNFEEKVKIRQKLAAQG